MLRKDTFDPHTGSADVCLTFRVVSRITNMLSGGEDQKWESVNVHTCWRMVDGWTNHVHGSNIQRSIAEAESVQRSNISIFDQSGRRNVEVQEVIFFPETDSRRGEYSLIY